MINEKKVMDTIRANPGLTMTELSVMLEASEAQIRQRCRFLRKYGMISAKPVPLERMKNTFVIRWYAEE